MSAIALSIVLASLLFPGSVKEKAAISPETVTKIEMSDALLSWPAGGEPEKGVIIAEIKEGDEHQNELSYLAEDAYTLSSSRPAPFPPIAQLSAVPLSVSSPQFAPAQSLTLNRCAPIFPMGKQEIRQFKRQLLEQLQEDQLIAGKKENVLIEVPEGEIKVNGQKLDSALFSKYADFLYPTIPPCQGRYLVIKHQFFGVGSYTEDGDFIGLSIYPKQSPSMHEFDDFETSLLSNHDLGAARVGERSLLNDEVGAQAEGLMGGMTQDASFAMASNASFAVLNGAQLRRLKRKLFAQLRKDQLINKEEKEAIIGFHEDRMVVNGKPLVGGQGTAYRGLIGQFGIDAGPRRELHLAPRFIIIGDFGEYGEMLSGQAHGKSMIVSKRMPSGLYAERKEQ